MINVSTAQELVRANVRMAPTEYVDLNNAFRRVLAEPLLADLDYPPFDRAMMDGYAIAAAAHAPASSFKVVDQIGAGSLRAEPIRTAQAVQINTGAPIPPGADTVVPVEQALLSHDGSTVSFEGLVKPGQHIARRGEYAVQGQTVLARGLRLHAGELAIAAAVGAARLCVYRRPEVAVLVTGNELVDVSQVPSGAQIRNSNGPLLHHWISQVGAIPKPLGVAPDAPAELETLVRRGLESDMLCLTGGISMGAFDFVPEILQRCGVVLKFQKVAMKPGKPTLFGVSPSGCLVFGLSGNPLSAMVGFTLYARPAIMQRMGQTDAPSLMIRGRLRGKVGASGGRQSYAPARVMSDAGGDNAVEALAWHGSGDPFGLAGANALIVRGAECGPAADGETVEAMLLDLY